MPANREDSKSEQPWRQTIHKGDTFMWQITLDLPHLRMPRILAEWDADGRATSGQLYEIGWDGGREPSTEHANAIDDLTKREESLYPRVLAAISPYAEPFRHDWVARHPEIADRIVPSAMTAEQVAERIAFTILCVSDQSRDGMAYLELMGECTWDRDHGFNVVIHGDRIVGVFQQGEGWVDESTS